MNRNVFDKRTSSRIISLEIFIASLLAMITFHLLSPITFIPIKNLFRIEIFKNIVITRYHFNTLNSNTLNSLNSGITLIH